jgi:hypothetical protein
VPILNPPLPAVVADPPVGIGLPDALACVSSPLPNNGGPAPEVLRITLQRSGAGFQASIARGPQFRTHSGVTATDSGNVEVRSLAFQLDGAAVELGEARGRAFGVTMSLSRDGVAWHGTYLDNECYQQTSAALVCWDAADGGSGLPAHYHWESGQCLDSSGQPAMNAIPIEMVREVGNGECADLSGVSINDQDFSYPELDGLNLVGARLSGARLFFAAMHRASLEGADLHDLQFGYATFDGEIDAHTVMPPSAGCMTKESPWAGSRCSCSQ